ncbi:MAG: hemolysin family protein [Muribaculaceae bacterium]|nr:hemolysin family protein [Muribaculaceae bacterium]MDE6771750.1 hemolysin family protein [Muribaculaceae bacterium]
MSLATAIIVTVIVLLLSGLFSGTEIAFVQSSKVRMEIDAARGGIIDRIIRRFSHHEDMFISTLLVGNNVVLVIYGITFSMIINPILQSWFDSEAMVLVINTFLSTGVVLLVGEFIPKTTFRINPNFMMRLMALPLYLIYLALYPVTLLVSGISRGLMRLFGIKNDSEGGETLTIEELDDYLQRQIDERDEDSEVENEVKIFRNAIDFKDTQIGECMIPRNEIVAVGIDSVTREELIRKFIATGLSKIVVFKEDIDDVLGYIHVSELFNVGADWKRRLKPVIFTPETMLANKMMRRMMAEKRSMVIVVDEFGGTAGLVTLEDLVEEIFGEIEDEHDRKKLLAVEVSPGVYEFSGRAEIEAINEEFGLDLKESDTYHTLGGFILDYLGALPSQDDSFDVGNLRFTILRMATTRIELVKVTKL